MTEREAASSDDGEKLNIVSTERMKVRGGQVVRAVIAKPSGDSVVVSIPVGSLDVPNLYEDN